MNAPGIAFGVLMSLLLRAPAQAIEYRALLDLRAVASDSNRSWLNEGLDKQRFDEDHQGIRLGQGILELRAQPLDTVSATVVANAYSDRDGVVDLSEAYLTWKPLPAGPWRWTARAGAFFPVLSLENSAPGWTSPYMLSTSAINTWVGEELRTLGAELTLSRPGRFAASPHDFSVSAAAFRCNDAAGGLITWRGWSLGDRVTGLSERVPLPELPIYGGNMPFASQVQWEEPFHEIDDRTGYYFNAEYGFRNQLRARVLHYDNRGDPFGFSGGQWAWDTGFDAFGASWKPDENWEFLAQYLDGKTNFLVRNYGVFGSYRAWYLLATHRKGAHRVSLRYDDFRVIDRDFLSADNNEENGSAWAIAYLYGYSEHIELGAEYLQISSDRPMRGSASGGAHNTENLGQFALRWHFD